MASQTEEGSWSRPPSGAGLTGARLGILGKQPGHTGAGPGLCDSLGVAGTRASGLQQRFHLSCGRAGQLLLEGWVLLGEGSLRGGGWASGAVRRYQDWALGNTELGSGPDPVATEEGMQGFYTQKTFMDLLICVRKVYKPQHPALCWLLGDPQQG